MAAARLEHAAVARMGISGLLPALKNIIEPQHVRKYAGQKVAVDTVCDRMPVCERPSVVGVCRRARVTPGRVRGACCKPCGLGRLAGRAAA